MTSKTKECPYCSERIARSAKKCKHCGEFLDRKLARNQKKQQRSAPVKRDGCFLQTMNIGCFMIVAIVVLFLWFLIYG